MDLNKILREKFKAWKPPAPRVLGRSKYNVTLDWQPGEPFEFLGNRLLYKVEKREKIPPWLVVYSGGKTTKLIENLAPRHCHKFRVQVILRASAVATLPGDALLHYGDADSIADKLKEIKVTANEAEKKASGDISYKRHAGSRAWLESQWSDETWTSTESEGASPVCFCMAVRCSYTRQLQAMLAERPGLVDLPSSNGLTPLATAVTKGDVDTARVLLAAGAAVGLPLRTGQTALHLAVLGAHLPLIQLLLEKGAQFQARDINGLRAEHYAVDSGSLAAVQLVLDAGGDVHVVDSNGWTPLFRAICQGASTEIIAELVARGSSVHVTDRAGLQLLAAAHLLTRADGRRRDSVLRLVDPGFPHEKALAHFTRLTHKISSVHSLLK